MIHQLPRLAAVLAALPIGFLAGPAQARQVLFVANTNNNTVGEYSGASGATINATFVGGQGLNSPVGLAMDGNNHFFVSRACY